MPVNLTNLTVTTFAKARLAPLKTQVMIGVGLTRNWLQGDCMFSVARDWNPKQNELAQSLKSKDRFSEAVDLCISMHTELHNLAGYRKKTIFQELIERITPSNAQFQPSGTFGTINWNLWHITRIEDAIASIIIGNTDQVFSEEIQKKINSPCSDTGNAFGQIDVLNFSKCIDLVELLKYRVEVGLHTERILKTLGDNDRSRKPTRKQLDRFLEEGVLTKEKDSIWLLDFWEKKTISGLLAMPITRHQIVHINDCFKLVERARKFAS